MHKDKGTAAEGAKAGAAPIHLTVGVTAHRDLLPEQEPAIRTCLEALFDELAGRFPFTPLRALCPLAEGGDRLFARVARTRGIPLVVPLPLPRAQYLNDFSGIESRTEFDALCNGAKVLELPLHPGVMLEEVARPGHARDREYAQLGVFLSSHSQILVAIWDGQRSGLIGGTDQIVRYRLYNVYPSHDKNRPVGPDVIGDDENDLTFHITCARARPDGGARPPEVTTAWLTGDPDLPRSESIADKYVRIFTTTGEFNREARAGDASAAELSRTAAARVPGGGIATINRTFRAANALANFFQRRLNLALRGTYLLAVLMGGVYVGYSTVPGERPLLYAFLGLFAAGLLLYGWARRGDWHRKYLDYRVLAEGLRVQYFWTLAGVGRRSDGRFVLESFLQKQDPDLGWIRHVMRDVELQAGVGEDYGARGVEIAIADWIGAPERSSDEGQINYYRIQARERWRLHRLTERIGGVCLWSGIAIAVFLAAAGGAVSPRAHTVLLLLLGLLPLIAAVRAAYSHKRADKELIKQYRFMERAFRNAHRRLAIATGVAEQREVLRVLGNAALEEHAEWILMHRERPLERSKL